MSLVNTLTGGLLCKEGERPGKLCGSAWKYGHYWISRRIILLPTYIRLAPMYLLSTLGYRWPKIVIGRALGYSGCSHCSMTWNYVKGKSIQFSANEGMFPLCEECFDKLPPEEIDPYIESLVQKTLEIQAKYGLQWDKKQSPQEVSESAKAEVRRMKSIEQRSEAER